MTDQDMQTIRWRLDRLEAEQAALRMEVHGLHEEFDTHMREAAAVDAEEREWRRTTSARLESMHRSVASVNWKLLGFTTAVALAALAALISQAATPH